MSRGEQELSKREARAFELVKVMLPTILPGHLGQAMMNGGFSVEVGSYLWKLARTIVDCGDGNTTEPCKSFDEEQPEIHAQIMSALREQQVAQMRQNAAGIMVPNGGRPN